MARVFLTGATGYVGGQALHSISSALPDLSPRTLIRSASSAETVKAAYPAVQVVQGSLDDDAVIFSEASKADIIINLADAKNIQSVRTIHEAMKQRETGRGPAHWIQMTGATVLAASEIADSSRTAGSPSSITFDDLDGLAAIRETIKKNPFRAVDNYMLEVAANCPQVNTALVIGPVIYGKGQGPVNQRSVQIPTIAKTTLQRRRGVQVGQGLSRWGHVHVADLGQLIVLLVKAALEGRPETDRVWNEDGIYITSTGETSFGDLSQRVAAAAAQKGLIPKAEVDQVLGDEANKLLPGAAALYGTNARGIGRRGEEVLGWAPRYTGDAGLEEEIPRAVDEEAEALSRI